MGQQRFDRPYGTENESKYSLLPSDESLGYYRPTLRVEILAVSGKFDPGNVGNDKTLTPPAILLQHCFPENRKFARRAS